MMLVGALHEHEGALRASLRAEYGIDLRNPRMNVLDLADMVGGLPPGCALWRAVGGPMGYTPEAQLMVAIEFRLHQLVWFKTKDAKTGANAPKPIEFRKPGEKVEDPKVRARREQRIRRRPRPATRGEE